MKIDRSYYRLIVLFSFSFIHCFSIAQVQSRWIQQSVISPDGRWIAYAYQGHIYKVPAVGGSAVKLTDSKWYSGFPIWSHDGKKIAFAADQKGDFDVFVMNADGTHQLRLTYNSSKDIPYEFSGNDRRVYFGTARHDVYTSARFPQDDTFMKLFAVPVSGGASIMINSAGMEFAHFNKKSDIVIFQDNKGSVEDSYRKHAVSSVTRDIWAFYVKDNVYRKLSDFDGEDREPVWGDRNDFFYLSEKCGTQNIFKSTLTNIQKTNQLTFFDKHPVRNLSRSLTGILCFTWNGDLYTLSEGRKPEKLFIVSDQQPERQPAHIWITKGSKDMDISPDGREIAFISRGDVYVTSSDGITSKRITNTPFEEKMVQFSPDGRSLMYSVEHKQSWDIEQVRLHNSNEHHFFDAPQLDTLPIINGPDDEFQGLYSPDGKYIAYLEEREVLKVFDVRTKTAKTVIPQGVNYSQSDGDQFYSWSPDSRSLLVQSGNNILLAGIDSSTSPRNLTTSGFSNILPRWGTDSKTMYWLSARYGLANFTGSENQYDICQMFFDRGEWEKACLDNSIRLAAAHEDSSKSMLNSFFIDRLSKQPVSKRLTAKSASINDILVSGNGKQIYFLGNYTGNFDLFKMDLPTGRIDMICALAATNPSMKMSRDGNTILLLTDNDQFKILNLKTGRLSNLTIKLNVGIDESLERLYVFDHIYKIMKKKFMNPELNHVDLDFYYQSYRQFIPYINNNYDFRILVAEFLGELNNSHIIPRYQPENQDQKVTAGLGLLYDLSKSKEGLLVKEIIRGGPFETTSTNMKTGMVIDEIDGHKVTISEDWSIYLNDKAGKMVNVKFHSSDGKEYFRENVKAVALSFEQSDLLYKRWVKRMEFLTDSLSGGKILYVHLPSMAEGSFRALIDKSMGQFEGRKALLVDTRFNRGGSLTGKLVEFLGTKPMMTEHRRGHADDIIWPEDKWTKPSAVLVNQANYSDAFIFPYVYKNNHIGKLIGMPVPGTGTGTTRDIQLVPGLSILIPERATFGPNQLQPTENHELEPDVKIDNDYNSILNGDDRQLKSAINVLMETIGK